MNFEFFLAFRYLKSPRLDKSVSAITILSTVGVSLGVIALVVVLSIMNGFERDLRSALIGINPHITLINLDLGSNLIDDDDKISASVSETIEAKAVLPLISRQALILGKGRPSGAYVRGIDVQKEFEYGTMSNLLKLTAKETGKQGSSDENTDEITEEILSNLQAKEVESRRANGKIRKEKLAGIILGKLLAQKLEVKVGDTIQLYSSAERISPMGNLSRAKKYRVVGLYSSGLSGYDEILAFIDKTEAQKIFQMEGKVNSISIYIDNPDAVEEKVTQLKQKFAFPYIFRTWKDDNKNLFQVIHLEKLGLAIILTLIILVAAFNIISSLIMLVNEKKKDVAILKSLGVKDSSILKIFMIQGVIIGFIGTFSGILLGLLICFIIKRYDIIDIPADVYVKNKIPLYIEWGEIFLIGGVSFLICFLVTLYPSKQAARMNPVESLKYE